MGLAEIVLLIAAGLASAFVIHEFLCSSRGEFLEVPVDHLAQARVMFWLMVGGVFLVGSTLMLAPSLLSGLLLAVVSLLAVGWRLRLQRMQGQG